VTLRNLQTGQYVTASLVKDQGRLVIQSEMIGSLVLERVIDRYRITYATEAEWVLLAELGYPAFLSKAELENLGPMGEFAQQILASCVGVRIRLADWSWEDPILEVWWRGLRVRASFHDMGPVLECQVGVERTFVNCSWSSDVSECFQKFANQVIEVARGRGYPPASVDVRASCGLSFWGAGPHAISHRLVNPMLASGRRRPRSNRRGRSS
jgi:hypothetical protein